MGIWLAVLAPAFGFSVDCSPVDGSGGVRGLPPLEVTCTYVPDAFTEGLAPEWLLGDGTVVEGDTVVHTYEAPGQYDIDLYLYEAGNPSPVDFREMPGHVTVCGVPQAEFTYVFRGGLSYDTVNRSDFLPGCVDTIRWSVHSGTDRSGPLVLEAQTWDARFELPEEGTYTFFLDLAGIAGATAARLPIEAEGGLPDALDNGSAACQTGPRSAVAGLLGLLGLLARRRR